jgi:amino acid adenylation domain-containing protein
MSELMNKFGSTTDFIRFSHSDLDQSIPERFEQQVQRYPDKLAVITRSDSVSYAELNRSASRLATLIQSLLADSEAPVAIFLDQGIPQITAIMAVLKAGRIYVPLDPSDSQLRIDFMLQDSGAALILTDVNNYRAASEYELPDRKIFNTGRQEVLECEQSGVPVNSGSTAYIYYTSGSTGKPKGVYDSHRNVLHNVMRYTNNLRISASDGLTLLQSCTFSGSVSNIFCSLLNGATLFPVDLRKEGIEGLASLLLQETVTIYHSVPAVFRQLMARAQGFPGLRAIRLEGDQCSMIDVRIFQRNFDSGCILVNGLGATETGIVRTFTIHPDTTFSAAVVPVGYACEDMETLLYDEAGAEVPVGETGEIMIRSRYLASGYWRNPDLTKAMFRPCPVDPEYRVYRTGDIGRMRTDGCLEHLGRRDFQVKLMGRWVAITEMEQALMQIEGVSEAVVSLHHDADGSRLVAYLVPLSPGSPPSASVIGQALANQMPGSVLPSAYVMLDTLPLGDSGKVNRGALPPPPEIRSESDRPFVAPGNAIEQSIADIWCEVLGLARVGVDDSFLYLGGNSLHATGIVIRINEKFLTALTLYALFENPTVSGLARVVADA